MKNSVFDTGYAICSNVGVGNCISLVASSDQRAKSLLNGDVQRWVERGAVNFQMKGSE